MFKAGEKDLSGNYRPISLVSNVAKIYEKLLHSRIVKFLDKYCIFSYYQFGFRKKYAAKDAISSITTAAVFLDIAKAFDTVDHEVLLKKLYSIGIRGLPLLCIENYLNNRKQVVRVNEVKSELLPIDIGVPQVTILGPLLFIIYINDIFENATANELIITYADDTVLIVYDTSWSRVAYKLQILLNKIDLCLLDNALLSQHKQNCSNNF